MKNILISTIFILFTSMVLAQDARFFYEGSYTGPYVDLNIGDVQYVNSDADAISIRIFNPNAAIKATRVDGNWQPYPTGSLFNYFVYTEQDIPYVGGTNQYEDINIKVECINEATSWQNLPQPIVFVPFDVDDVNPHPGNDHNLKGLLPSIGHRMLVLRKAFLWENSEDVGGIHGPYGDVKIGAYDPAIFSNPNYLDPNVAANYAMEGWWKSELPGPIWGGYAPWPDPDPYDEWIDNPFGCVYSNIAIWDWGLIGTVPNNAQIGVLLREADTENPEDILGGEAVSAGQTGLILVRVLEFGWVLLENVDVYNSEPKISLDGNEKVFWFGGWDGQYPVNVYGPQNQAVPCESCPGNQFRPFTDSQFWDFYYNDTFSGWKVGLLGGGNFPLPNNGIFDKPRIFYAIDKPVTFGVSK